MVAGFLMVGLVAGLAAGAVAGVLGHAIWVMGLAYMLGGMLGVGLALVWGQLWMAMTPDEGAGLLRKSKHRHGL